MHFKHDFEKNPAICAFLKTSREHLALSNDPAISKPAATVSNLTSKSDWKQMSSYRKIAQSFLLALGVGAFSATPAMADSECEHMGKHHERHAHAMEKHHAHLHQALKLSAEQEPAWKKLMESEQAKPSMSGGKSEDWSKLSAPERAEKMLELNKARLAAMAEHVTALKDFYAALTPDQQKTFEDFHAASRGKFAGKTAPKTPGASTASTKP